MGIKSLTLCSRALFLFHSHLLSFPILDAPFSFLLLRLIYFHVPTAIRMLCGCSTLAQLLCAACVAWSVHMGQGVSTRVGCAGRVSGKPSPRSAPQLHSHTLSRTFFFISVFPAWRRSRRSNYSFKPQCVCFYRVRVLGEAPALNSPWLRRWLLGHARPVLQSSLRLSSFGGAPRELTRRLYGP
jgi:hypothetical protein